MYNNTDVKQPDRLEDILALRPEGADIPAVKPDDLYDRMRGAVIGRFAGCVLGIPVELYSMSRMQALALDGNMKYPPEDFWTLTDDPERIHYRVNKRTEYLRDNLDAVPVDDDITYPVLNLLLLEKYGKNYTVDDIARLWLDILPYACTAEDEALQQLRAGTRAECAANFNGYVEWIGAAIRADMFGYAEAGNPVGAAKLAYNDAYLTHRKNGIYGEMFCAAAVAAAFTAETPLDAVRAAMSTEEFEPIADIAARIEGEDVTVSKVTYRLGQLVKNGEAEKTQIEIAGDEGQKKRKIMGYKLIG